MGYFYTDANNQVQGPVTESTLKGLVNEGAITPQSYVVEETETQWKTFNDYFPSSPELNKPTGLSSTSNLPSHATTTLYTLTHTGPINIKPIEIAKKTPKAILLKDYTRLADGSKKKLLMIGIDTVSKTPKDAVKTFIKAQEERVAQIEQQLNKERSKLEQAHQILRDFETNPSS
ncbi:MAG: DUF4339 domain-containing protein [Verrucomicrobiota bacterium]